MNDVIDLVNTSSEDEAIDNDDGIQNLSSQLSSMALKRTDANNKKPNKTRRLVKLSSKKYRDLNIESDSDESDSDESDSDSERSGDHYDEGDRNNNDSICDSSIKSKNRAWFQSKSTMNDSEFIDLVDTSEEEIENHNEIVGQESESNTESEVEEYNIDRTSTTKGGRYQRELQKEQGIASLDSHNDHDHDGHEEDEEHDEKDEVNHLSDGDDKSDTSSTHSNKNQASKELTSKELTSSTNWVKTKTDKGYYYTLPRSSSSSDSIQFPKIQIPSELYKKLYEHQRIGVEWIASLHIKGTGGILGDDMGLGKTMQTLAGIGGLMVAKTIRNALIICPKSVLLNWEREARDVLVNYCGLNVDIVVLESNIRQERRERLLLDALHCTSSRPQVIITTYGLIKSSTLHFVGGGRDESLYWDYCILDEGHQIKNVNTQQHKSCSRVCLSSQTRRLLLTGTPIQNNMKELWSLFDWASSGKLLGKLYRFQNQFAIPIENGRNKNASEWTLRTAQKANQRLQSIIKPHFLQRMKNEEFAKCLPKKKEYVVWSHLSDTQRKLYESYLIDSGKVSAVLSGETRSPLEAITYLKKLCDHPSLIADSTRIDQSDLINSGKLDLLCFIVQNLRRTGHRCLIFSPSTKMLDIIEATLKVNLARIDGSTKGRDRQRLVDEFNSEGSYYDAMLLSTKAAGVGLNLTGADRAIIYSPSWNPADDSQAVDRCYRIGQTKNVVVYRFITSGTVEERMYEKQVHKDGIRRTITTSSGCATERYFDDEDLRKMFTLAPRGVCQMLEKMERVETSLSRFGGVVGISSHDKVYFRSTINIDCAPSEAPFASTPLKKNNAHRPALTSMSPNETDLIAKIGGLNLSCDKKKTNNLLAGKGEIKAREDATQRKTRNGGLQQNVEFDKQLEIDLEQIDRLSSDGRFEKSLLILFHLLENEELRGAKKLKIHKMIASRAICLLQWQKDLQ